MSQVPKQLKYTEKHEWIAVSDDGVATMGITDFAQGELGDIVFVELPQPGDTLQRAASFGTIEAVKTVEDLYAPVSGEVVAVNTALQDEPTLINTSPYEDGWILKLRLSDPAEVESLLSAQQYSDQIGEAH